MDLRRLVTAMLKVATSILGRDRTQRIVGGFEFTKVIEEREATPHVAGVLYFAAFVGISSGFQQDGADLTSVVLVFTAVVVLGWAWISVLSVNP